jgi:hypothetical protein
MSEHGGTSLSQLTIDAKIIALYSTLSQTLVDKYEHLALIGNTDNYCDPTVIFKVTDTNYSCRAAALCII